MCDGGSGSGNTGRMFGHGAHVREDVANVANTRRRCVFSAFNTWDVMDEFEWSHDQASQRFGDSSDRTCSVPRLQISDLNLDPTITH